MLLKNNSKNLQKWWILYRNCIAAVHLIPECGQQVTWPEYLTEISEKIYHSISCPSYIFSLCLSAYSHSVTDVQTVFMWECVSKRQTGSLYVPGIWTPLNVMCLQPGPWWKSQSKRWHRARWTHVRTLDAFTEKHPVSQDSLPHGNHIPLQHDVSGQNTHIHWGFQTNAYITMLNLILSCGYIFIACGEQLSLLRERVQTASSAGPLFAAYVSIKGSDALWKSNCSNRRNSVVLLCEERMCLICIQLEIQNYQHAHRWLLADMGDYWAMNQCVWRRMRQPRQDKSEWQVETWHETQRRKQRKKINIQRAAAFHLVNKR